MKKLIYFLLVVSQCAYTNRISAQHWSRYNPAAIFDVNTVDILKPGYLVIGGGQESADSVQVMFSSPDYGVTWNENPHDGLASWNTSVAFADTLNGYGVGYQGRIISTNDGGLNWGHAVFPINRNFNKIVNASPRFYYAVGGINSLNAMQTVIKSSDSGTTWQVMYDTAGPDLNSVFFTTVLKGFAVGDSGVILTTTNGGSSWSRVTAPVQRDFKGITFINSTIGFITGGSQAGPGRRTILRTQDGGTTWTLLSDTIGGILNDVSFADFYVGYIVGDSAGVLKTSDGGLTWAPLLISNTLTGTETFRSVKFNTRNFGVIGGKAGVLFVYTGWPEDVFTLGANVKDSADADLFASINTHGYPGSVNFVYSTDSTFATSSSSTPIQSIKTDTFMPSYVTLAGLIPNTWYYYFAAGGTNRTDTLRFYTGAPYPVFRTLPGNVIDSNRLLLRGEIHGITPVTNLEFEYGTTPYLGQVIAASLTSVGDTAEHLDSALLTSVQPYTIYYYRLRGIAGVDTLYGNIYFTGNPIRLIETMQPTYLTDTGATLGGKEQGFHGPVTFTFEYWTTQGSVMETYPNTFLNGDTINVFQYSINGLLPSHLYFYRFKVQTSLGPGYGKLLAFFTNSNDTLVQTLAAQSAGTSSATLEGSINHLPVGAALSFEYSIDSSFANVIAASPATINDTLFHSVSALLTGIPANTTYSYRLIATTDSGAILYGDIRTVYIGDNEIPNWDFQYWDHNTYNMPAGWNIGGKNFSRVPGHAGNYALNLTGVNIAIIGFPLDGGRNGNGNGSGLNLIGGVPFTGRPDSLSFYMKGSLVQGDSAAVVICLKKGTTVVAQSIHLIGVNTGGAFQRVSLPLHYLSSLSPDTLVLGVVSGNPGRQTPGNQSNTLTVDDFEFIPATSGVYNGDMETWFDYTCDLAQSWYSPVFYGLDSTNVSHVTPIGSKTVFSPPYDFAAEVSSSYFTSLGLMRGDMGTKTTMLYGSEAPSFPVNTRHHTLNGFCKAFPDNGDSLVIEVFMYYRHQQVGYGVLTMTDSITQFSPFEVPVSYQYYSYVPTVDSADIEIHTYGINSYLPKGLSRLIVDKLRFDGFAPDTGTYTGIISPVFDENGIKVYPNPARNNIMIEMQQAAGNNSIIQLFDLDGRMAKEIKVAEGETRSQIDLSDVTGGFYIIRFISDTRVYNKKIIIVK